MAQRRGFGRLARRYGLTGRGVVAAACVALLAVAVALAVARAGAQGEALIRRGDAAGQEEPAGETGSSEVAAEGAGEAEGGGEASEEGDTPQTVVVHVDGAVAAPGVYELEAPARVADAVAAAGGLEEGASTEGVNLAAPVSDGEKVRVPEQGEEPAAGSSAASAQAAQDAPVNINTASAEELDELPGVGEATALAIIEERERNGPFSCPEDIMRVSGIGEKKYEKLVGRICV